MENLLNYDSEEDNNTSLNKQVPISSFQYMSSAPQPLVIMSQLDKATNEFKENSRVEIMLAPEQGPQNPFSGSFGHRSSRYAAGKIQEVFVEDHFFNDSYHNYLTGDEAIIKQYKKVNCLKRKKYADEENLGDDSLGPWIPVEVQVKEEPITTTMIKIQKEKSKNENNDEDDIPELPTNVHIIEPDQEAEKWEKINERKQSYILPPRPSRGDICIEAKTTFHGQEEKDYQGRSWTSVPAELRNLDEDHECFIPKKCVKKFIGHSKGVQQIELFPKTGHLLLSGSMDGKCKVWDVAREKNVLRTYSGHSEGIRSIHMSNDGSQFLSSGFDRYVRLWDLETGQAVGTFSNRKMNYQVKFYPKDNHIFLCAASDNRIYQWDTRTGEICQEYNYHLQACNTIAFFDEGRKFVSTSDDKKVLIWEYDIPVPIKYIAEPEMHSIPSTTVHPSGKYFIGQSMDNTLVTYNCGEKVNQIKKKTFRGHNNAGFACQVAVSPNGRFVASGDGFGKLHFWDWKTCKEFRKLQAHESGPCICTVWHPLMPSWVFTCGWDGQVKMWD